MANNANGIRKSEKEKPKEIKKGEQIFVLAKQITELTRRMRMLEERHNNLRSRVTILDQTLLRNIKRLDNEVGHLNDEIKEINKEFHDLKEKMKKLIVDVQTTAKREDVETIKHYLEFFRPLEFITRKDVEKMINERIKR